MTRPANRQRRCSRSSSALIARAGLVPSLMLALSACGGYINTESPGSGIEPEAQDPGLTENPTNPTPWSSPYQDGSVAVDGMAVGPDMGVPPDPGSSNCPAVGSVSGSYSGTFDGNIKALMLNVPVNGTLSFKLVPAQGDTLTVTEGKFTAAVGTATLALPMKGTVTCGKLDGYGDGDMSGTKFSGKFAAVWNQNLFQTGTWSGTDQGNIGAGSGTWRAARQ